MTDHIKCNNDRRKEITIKSELNGIDYVEVVSSKKKNVSGFDSLIFVSCLKEVKKSIGKESIVIVGGSRIKKIKIHWAKRADQIDENLETISEDQKKIFDTINLQDKKKTVVIHTDRGDFSTYSLYLTNSQQQFEIPFNNFDQRLSKIDFVYSSDCDANFDCKSEDQCFPEILEEYDMDYMAKDYASFRQNILDRLSNIMPKWKERNPADLGITLVELLAYVADNLSYYQDAVANEAYLGTARKRVSIKRHTRLLNYYLDEGRNARTWICIQVDDLGHNTVIPKNTKIIPSISENNQDSKNPIISESNFEKINNDVVFQTMYDITLRKSLNEIHFHAWSNPQCCLPKGATSATLQNKNNKLYENLLFRWNKLQKTDRQIDGNLTPDDISKSETKSILSFFNSIQSEKDIVNAIEFPEEIDVGAKIGKRIIKKREEIGYFKTLSEINDIPFIGPERFTEIVLALRAHLSKEERERLFSFIKRSFDISWIENAWILRNDAKKEFVISDWKKDNKIRILFDENSSTATLEHNEKKSYEFLMKKNNDKGYDVYALNILRGDILVFEEILSPKGKKEDADKTHRQAIRVTKVVPLLDRVENTPVVEIHWDVEDALSFPLCIYNYQDPTESSKKELPISVALGNVVLADHGYTKKQKIRNTEDLKDHLYYSLEEKGIVASQSLGMPSGEERFYPYLSDSPLTFSPSTFDASIAEPSNEFSTVSSLFDFDENNVLPEIEICGEGDIWKPKKDLLSSGKFDRNFVVEIDDEGIASIRFGDDEHGKRPRGIKKDDEQSSDGKYDFYAKFRVGNGQIGNVGSDSLKMIVSENKGITSVRNPMTAKGGVDAESIMRAQQMAPNSFQKQQRAVTEDDYTEILEKHPDIQKAKATMRWTGSWHTVFVTIDRFGGLDVDKIFKKKISTYLEKYRLAGYDLKVVGPKPLPVDIVLRIHVFSDHYKESVREKLLEEFSNRKLSSKKNGFFHPDNFTFDQPLFLSQLYKTALDVDGVESVEILKFQRWGKLPRQEIDDGFIEPGISEIIRADNDPTFPDNGKIDFDMCGGL